VINGAIDDQANFARFQPPLLDCGFDSVELLPVLATKRSSIPGRK
jgi:hypothetical protein